MYVLQFFKNELTQQSLPEKKKQTNQTKRVEWNHFLKNKEKLYLKRLKYLKILNNLTEDL